MILSKVWQIKSRLKKDLKEQLLISRGIKDTAEFLSPRYEALADPLLMKGVKPAIPLIKKAKRITIFGDYDADGVTATAILQSVLPKAKIYIPDRKKEGYGLNIKAVTEAAKQSDLFITADCGITDVGEVALAKSLGVKVIITDHHQLPKILPPATVIINPHQAGCLYPFKDLCGAGVAFTLARALLGASSAKAGQEKWLLDLAAIGTIADMVPLLGENRILVKYGLLVIPRTRRLGLKKLLPEKIDAEAIAFRIAPRLNAAGRMDHANTSFRLLTTESEKEANRLAEQLESTNNTRQTATKKIISEVLEIMAKGEEKNKLIFAMNNNWPVGVLGLAAGRLMESFHRPTVMLSQGIASCRSIEGFNITNALESMGDLLEEFGGHPRAAGFRIKKHNIPELKTRLLELANKAIKPEDMITRLNIDAEVNLGDLSRDLVSFLETMAPFGVGNPKPLFLLKNASPEKFQLVGKSVKHLRFVVAGEQGRFKAIYFNGAGFSSRLAEGKKLDLVFELEKDEWNGRSNLQLKIVDLRSTE